jgi:hypothetical protein
MGPLILLRFSRGLFLFDPRFVLSPRFSTSHLSCATIVSTCHYNLQIDGSNSPMPTKVVSPRSSSSTALRDLVKHF